MTNHQVGWVGLGSWLRNNASIGCELALDGCASLDFGVNGVRIARPGSLWLAERPMGRLRDKDRAVPHALIAAISGATPTMFITRVMFRYEYVQRHLSGDLWQALHKEVRGAYAIVSRGVV